MPSKKSKPVGKALAWSDADLDRLTEITPEDVASAKAHSARLMPAKLKPLMKAKKKPRG